MREGTLEHSIVSETGKTLEHSIVSERYIYRHSFNDPLGLVGVVLRHIQIHPSDSLAIHDLVEPLFPPDTSL